MDLQNPILKGAITGLVPALLYDLLRFKGALDAWYAKPEGPKPTLRWDLILIAAAIGVLGGMGTAFGLESMQG